MNNNEANTILMRLDKVYAGFEYRASVVYEWQKAFDKDSFQAVSAAIDEYIKNSAPDAVPTINKIKSYLPERRKSFNAERWLENRKWMYEMQGDKAIKREMRYKINRWGEIEDEYGRIFADPDEETNRQLINKVRATGRLV